ncbi:hypothetical protein [Saccharothrix stipae]
MPADKEVESLALRHQITILERQPGNTRPRFSPADRMFPTALPHRLPVATLHRLRLPVRPETVLRWHRGPFAAARSGPKRPGRPRTVRSIRLLVLRLAQDNPTWGYRRITELLVLGITVAAYNARPLHPLPPATDKAAVTHLDIRRRQRLGGILNEDPHGRHRRQAHR